MNKIVNYIRNGKGRGLLFLLAASVLVAIVVIGIAKRQYTIFRPQLIATAEEILPISVQNGKIISPENTYKKFDLKFYEDDSPDEAISIVLDTREDAQDVSFNKIGLYIMKDVMYVVSPTKIERVALQDGVWDKEAAEKLLDYFVGVLWLIASVVVMAILFLMFLVKTLFLVLYGKLDFKFSGNAELFNFGQIMRLSAVVVAVIETLFLTLGMLLPTTGLQRFFIELIIVVIFVNREKRTQA